MMKRKPLMKWHLEKINKIRKQLDTNEKDMNTGEENSDMSNTKYLEKFQPITSNELKSIICSMKTKTCKLDPIPTQFVKKFMQYLLPIILHVINSSIHNKVFPNILKKAIVTPLIKDKSKSHDEYSNYRPVSLTPFLAKVLERALYPQINHHIESNNLHCKFQSSYRKNFSCETALTRVVGDIQYFVSEGFCVLLVLLDNSAAFDTVDHSILLKRLELNFNIKQDALCMINSYLSNREFSVAINDEIGKSNHLKHGVPQGSILGPLFYILYVKNVEQILQQNGVEASLYADDVQLYVKFKPELINNAVEIVEKCVKEIKTWMNSCFLKLNPEKTMMKLFTPPKTTLSTFHLNVGSNKLIKPSASVTVLGVELGEKMDFSEFINSKIRSCNFHLRNFKYIKHCLPQKTRILLVNSFIFSVLDYSNVLLVCLPGYQIEKLQKIMNKAVRFILNVRFDEHITPYLFQLHFLPVKLRIKFKTCLIAFKIVNKIAPEYLEENFKMFTPNSSINLRPGTGRDEKMIDMDLKQRKKNILYTNLVLNWNNLPQNIRKITSLNSFKSELKTHLFKIAFKEFL